MLPHLFDKKLMYSNVHESRMLVCLKYCVQCKNFVPYKLVKVSVSVFIDRAVS